MKGGGGEGKRGNGYKDKKKEIVREEKDGMIHLMMVDRR